MAHSKITKNIRNSCGGAWNSERRIAQYYCKLTPLFFGSIDDLPTNATTNNHSRHLKPMSPTKWYHAQDQLFVFPNMFFSRLTPMRTWYVLPPIWRSMKSLKGMQPGTPPGDWKSSKPSDHFSAESHGFKVPKHLGNPHMMIHIKTMTMFGSFRTCYFGMSLIRSSLNVWFSFLSFR